MVLLLFHLFFVTKSDERFFTSRHFGIWDFGYLETLYGRARARFSFCRPYPRHVTHDAKPTNYVCCRGCRFLNTAPNNWLMALIWLTEWLTDWLLEAVCQEDSKSWGTPRRKEQTEFISWKVNSSSNRLMLCLIGLNTFYIHLNWETKSD